MADEEIVKILSKITERLEVIETRQHIPSQSVKGHDSFVLNQVTKYNGSNIKSWLSTVKSAFKSCGYSRFLESEIPQTDPEYKSYDNCLGTIRLMFEPSKLEIIDHCKTVFEVWSYMAKIEKDTFATAVRKYMELSTCKYTGGPLRVWFETLIARFEAIESDWCTYSDKHRCVVVIGMLRSVPKFDQLADRIVSRQNCSMKDIINLFIEYDENVKINSLTVKNTFESAKTLKKNGFNKNFQRSTIKCTYCNRIGHKTEECRIKFWNENKNKTASSSKISSNVQSSSPSTSTTSSSSSTTPKTFIKRVAKSVINKRIDNMSNIWILDSACTSHTTIQGDKLINPIYKEIEFEIASGDVVKSELVGDVIIKPTEETELFLKDVVYGNFNSNLISIRKLILDDYEIFFGKERALIKKDDIVIEAMLFQDLWIISEMSKPKICNIWHKRLGHCCTKILSRINKVEPQINLKNEKCEDCCMNKSVSLPHKVKMVYDDIDVFEMLHIDLWQAPELSCGGSRYAMLIIDHFSRFCFGIPLKHKSDATNELIEFILKKEKCFKTKVKRLRTDRGGEFINDTFKAFCSEKGIDHETTVGYSPEQNGIVERMNRTVFSTVRTLLNSANVPKKYWAETMATAIYLINSWIRDDELSPYEKMFNKKPNYRHLRTFGCVAYVHQNQMKRLSKLDETARKLMFIGYSGSIVNYVLLDPEIDEIIVTNDVKFNESKMFFEQISSSSNLSSSSISDFSSPFINDLNSQNVDLTSSNSADSFEETTTNSVNEDDSEFIPEYTTESTETVDIVENSFPRRSSRQNFGIPPIRYGYKCINSFVVPSTYEEALSLSDSEDWKKAIQNEIDQLQKYRVFRKVPFDKNCKIIPTKWIFTRKRNGSYKAHLVAKGFTQKFGIDFSEITSPTPEPSLVNLVLSYAKTFGYKNRQIDIRTAFLNAPLSEALFVAPPPGFVHDGLLKLEKALYGLKQSPLAWYNTITEFLLYIGFERCLSDKCFFKMNDILLLIYVDDILMVGPDEDILSDIVKQLETKFEVTDIGKVHDFLGVEIIEKPNHFELWQGESIKKILEQYNLTECKPARVPMASLYLQPDDEEIDNNLPVQQIIGSLLYLANRTRPDISFAVNWLSRFSKNPTQSLFAACKMVLRYLSRTIDKKLIIGRLNSTLSVYTDSSFGQGTSRHSTTGIIVRCGESTIKWKSVKQRKISISSCEAEITAILEGYRIAEFLLHIFNWLQYHIEIKFLCDNQSAIHLIKKSNSMKKSRYFDLEVKKLIELFSTNQLYNINYVPTKEQISDCLTKPLNEKLFLICIEKIFI